MTSPSLSPLRRFVTDGLHETVRSYTAGTLPLHRFAWELHHRLRTLAELTELPHWRTLQALHTAQHTIEAIDDDQRTAGRAQPTSTEEHAIASAVTALRTGLARLDPTDPIDPDPALPSPTEPSRARRARRERHLRIA